MITAQVGICELNPEEVEKFGVTIVNDPTGKISGMPIITVEIDGLEHEATLDEEDECV